MNITLLFCCPCDSTRRYPLGLPFFGGTKVEIIFFIWHPVLHIQVPGPLLQAFWALHADFRSSLDVICCLCRWKFLQDFLHGDMEPQMQSRWLNFYTSSRWPMMKALGKMNFFSSRWGNLTWMYLPLLSMRDTVPRPNCLCRTVRPTSMLSMP